MKYLLLIALLLFFSFIDKSHASCSAGFDCSERGVGIAGSEQCGNGNWESLLVTQESGGNYSIKAPNTSATGRYQFINSTRNGIGEKYSLPCSGKNEADRQGFANCPGLQDIYARKLWESDLNGLMSNSTVANAVNSGTTYECPVTASGITALAHNVGPECARLWASGGEAYMKANGPTFKGVPSGTPACTDANGTNAVQKYACAMGGFDMSDYLSGGSGGAVASGCGFGFTPANPPSVSFQNSSLIGCDPAIMEKVKARNDAVRQVSIEAAKSIITEPADIAMMSCLDQQQALLNASGGIFSNPGGDISATLGPLAQQPLMKEVNNFMGGVSAQLNAVNNAFTQVTSNITKSFTDALGLGGGSGTTVPSTDCGVASDVFNLSQCLQMPEFPSLSGILDEQIGRITGILNPNQPTRSLEQICSAANSQIGGIMGDIQSQINAPFENAADSLLSPIERNVNQIENAPYQIYR